MKKYFKSISCTATPRKLKNEAESQKNGVTILFDEFSWQHFIYIEPKCV